MKLQFFMPMIPPRTTAQQQRILKNGRVVKGAKVSEAQRTLTAHLWPYRPEAPMVGPLRVTLIWQWAGKKPGWKVTRPDCDNLAKGILDPMTQIGFWRDDAQVVDLRIAKCWGDVPGIYIEVEEIQ